MSIASLESRVDQIEDKLQLVVQGKYKPFGVGSHRFRIIPALTEREVLSFESRHGVELPIEYRKFLTHVSNGGAGPAYGMFTLEEALSKERYGSISDDFLSTPFPHVEAYNPFKDPEIKALWQRVERGEVSRAESARRELYQTAGTLILCHEGCGYLHFLVVTGPTRDQMWLDGRCSDGGFVPLGVGFLDWYERWLDSILAGGDGLWWLSYPEE